MVTTIAPANVRDTEAADKLLQGVQGWALADRNYWKPNWQVELE